MKLDLKATKVLEELHQAEKDGYNVILLEGGSRSSKTYSIMQFFELKAMLGESFDVTIMRQTLQLIKDTLLDDFEATTEMYKFPVSPDVNFNRPSQRYKINDGIFNFWGLDKPKKAHGKKQKYAWFNEVIEIPNKQVFDQIEMRTTGLVIIDYNPSDDTHWVFDLHKRDDVKVLRSTQLDNPFLERKIREKIMSYEPTEANKRQGTADSYMWNVYGLGRPDRLTGVIYTNWGIVDSIPENAEELGLGLDFGYTNHQTALIDIYLYNNELYLDELIYKRGLRNASPHDGEDTIVERMKALGIEGKEITADSAEPKSIDEISAYGFDIDGAEKGTDSVIHGIEFLKGYKMNVTRRSVNLQTELRKYKWKEGKDGKPTNTPIKEFDHALDAIRYRVTKVLKPVEEVEFYPTGIIG